MMQRELAGSELHKNVYVFTQLCTVSVQSDSNSQKHLQVL